MTTELLAEGVQRIATGRGDRENAFLVDGDDGLTLIDVGWAGAPAVLTNALAERGHGLADVRRIVITHAHPDHVRGLAEFHRLTRAKVLIHAGDADWLRRGRVPVSGRHGRIGALVDALPLLHWQPVIADGELVDGELIEGSGGLRVIHTPGHSPGHVVIRHEPSRTVLVGDAIFHRGAQPERGPAALCHDPATRDASLARLPVDVDAVGFAHGAPLTGGAVEVYRNWLAENLSSGQARNR